MSHLYSPIFLVANLAVLAVIFVMNRKSSGPEKQIINPKKRDKSYSFLDPSDILGWEFEYARTTASEAMRDRLTMINYYLLMVGVIMSGIVAVKKQENDPNFPQVAGTVLLWLICVVGWFYFLKLIRLRQAWHESTRAMNQIKDFYIQHAKVFEPSVLENAFLWTNQTLPPPGKLWTVFFYSAMLIGFLDSIAFVGGGIFINGDSGYPISYIVAMGGMLFAFHFLLYWAFLKPQ